MSARINARLDEDVARKLRYLERHTRLRQSDIVRRAIDLYFDAVKHEAGEAGRLLDECGFVGCASGDSTLSQRYKDEFGATLREKS